MAHPSVAILGVGAMGTAMATGLLASGWEPESLALAVRRPASVEALRERYGCEVTLDPAAAAANMDVVVVAVKPRDVGGLLDQVAASISETQVVISLAAGVPIERFEARMPDVPIIRAMPNTPALVGEGVTGMAAGSHTREADLAVARMVLEAVGSVTVMEESLLNAVTAVSGTGPAYVFMLAEALTEAAIREGLPRDIAGSFVHQTIKGAGHLLVETDSSPFELRGQVTSPGGTTAAAVHVLEERGFRAIVEDAVRAAAQRSRELGDSADEA